MGTLDKQSVRIQFGSTWNPKTTGDHMDLTTGYWSLPRAIEATQYECREKEIEPSDDAILAAAMQRIEIDQRGRDQDSKDEQLAGFGELIYGLTEQLERIADAIGESEECS